MSASRGNYVGLKEAPRSSSVMRIPDELLDQWYRLVMEADGPPDSESAGRKACACEVRRDSGAREEAAAAAEAHFTRVVREGLEPGGRLKQRCPTAIRFISRPCSSTCSASARRVRPGGYSHRAEAAGRRGGAGSRCPPRASRRRAAPGGEASFRAIYVRVGDSSATMVQCRLARGSMKPAIDTGDPSSREIRPTYQLARGAFGASRRLFSALSRGCGL